MSVDVLDRDVRCYVTDAGIAAEVEALTKGSKLEITSIVIDGYLLPDDQNPWDVTEVKNPVSERFPLMVNVDKATGILTGYADVPANVGGFVVNGVAWLVGDLVYAYNRGYGDVKRAASSGQNDYLRYEIEVITKNANAIEHTYDETTLLATHSNVEQLIKKHVESDNPHEQYIQKENITNEYNAESQELVLSQKGAKLLHESMLSHVEATKSQIMGGLPPSQIDSIFELAEQLQDNDSELGALNSQVSQKANKIHSHDNYIDTEMLTGLVSYFNSNSAMPGWIDLKAGELNRVTDARLWAYAENGGLLISQQLKNSEPIKYAMYFGDGDGTLTFTLPNFHLGHFVRGAVGSVGETQGDAIRNITGTFSSGMGLNNGASDAFFFLSTQANKPSSVSGFGSTNVKFDASRVVPTADENRPKAANLSARIFRGFIL